MANDPPPPPPQPSEQFFSARNEQKSVLTGPDDIGFLIFERVRASDDEALFIQCMPDTARRRIAFNVVERNCREAFARGKAGVALFLKVRDLVELAQVEEAINEFDKRFEPMLDQRVLAAYSGPE